MRPPLSLEFRILFIAILGVIVPFGLLLYFLPGQTNFYWAWVIAEPRSARLIGAAYFGAVFYYLLILRENDWVQTENGLGGLITFSSILLVATMIHWDTFRPYHPITLVWLSFYYGGPFLVPIFYRQQTARLGAVPVEGTLIAPGARAWLIGRGFFYLGLALLGLVFASTLSAAWPWPIQPLDLRVFMAQVGIAGWGGLAALQHGQPWRRHRLGLVLIGTIGLLQLIGLLITPTLYAWSSPLGLLLPVLFSEWVLTPLVLLSIYRKQP